MRVGIKGQLLAPVVILVAGFVVVCLWATRAIVNRENAAVAAKLDAVARTVDRAQFPLTAAVLEQLKSLTGADFLVERHGESLTTLPGAPTTADLTHAEAPVEGDLGRPVSWAGVRFFVRHSLPPPGRPNAPTDVVILYPEQSHSDAVSAAVGPVLGFGLGGAFLVGALTLALGGRLVARVRAVEAQTRRIAAGDFAPMPVPTRRDELRDLTESVNALASRLSEFEDTLRRSERWRLLGQVSGGIAHELRNGIAGARLALQLHDQEQGPTSEPLAVALNQLDLVGLQLRRFLDLGRVDPAPAGACAPADVAREALSLVGPRCRHLGVKLEWESPADLPVAAVDRVVLLQMLLNLLGNAVDACGPGGAVRLRVSAAAGSLVAEVGDTGPGPPDAIADELFEPFVTGKPDGVGLGLTAVRDAASAYGGVVAWQRRNGQTQFRVTLPLAAPDA